MISFGFGGFFMVLFWILLIWAFFVLMRQGCCGHDVHTNDHAISKHSAKDIAEKRYARGEISKAEFEEIKKNI